MKDQEQAEARDDSNDNAMLRAGLFPLPVSVLTHQVVDGPGMRGEIVPLQSIAISAWALSPS